MKKIIIILCVLVLIGYGSIGGSIGAPDVKTTTWLNVPFEAVDTTTGVGRIPDSVSVITFFGNCTNAGIFQVSSASLDSNWWDSTQTGAGVASSKIYYFKEVVADIDADSGAGFYSGVINAWFQGYPMPTYFSFNLVDTTAQEYGSITYLKIATIWNHPTRSLTHFEEVTMTVDWDATLNARSAIGDTNTKDMGDTLTLIMAEILNLDGWTPSDSFTIDISNAWPLVADRPAIGDTNSKDMGDTLKLIMAEIVNLDAWDPPDSTTIDMSNAWPLVSTRPAIGDTNQKDLGDTLTLIMAEIVNLNAWAPSDSFTIDISNAWPLVADRPAIGDTNSKDLGDTLTLIMDEVVNLDAEMDSLLAVLYDRTNDTTFIRILSQYVLKHLYPDSVTIDNSNAWDLSGGTDLSVEVDSILATLYDRTNDTAFVLILSQYVLKHLYPDSVTIDNSNAWDLSGGGDVSVEVDSILAAIYDRANDTSFVRIIAQYVLLRLHPDSLRAYLATHDSTLLEQAAACGSGTGVRTVTITVLDDADSTTAISGFEVDVYDSSSGEPKGNGTTNSNGVYTCSLDDETYTVHIKKTPWTLTSPRRFVITADLDSTFYATPFTPGSPPADSLCVVWGRVKDKHGDPYVGAKVSIWMDAYPVTFGGILIDVATKSVVYTDALGVFEFSDGIYYSSSLNPSNLKWKVRVKTKNAEWIWEGMVAVPSQASWEIEIPDL